MAFGLMATSRFGGLKLLGRKVRRPFLTPRRRAGLGVVSGGPGAVVSPPPVDGAGPLVGAPVGAGVVLSPPPPVGSVGSVFAGVVTLPSLFAGVVAINNQAKKNQE